MSVASALQKLIRDRLRATPAVSNAIGGRVYDSVPKDPIFPYLSFGSYDFVPDDSDCIFAGVHTQMLDIWSRKVGRVECKDITEAVRRVLRGYETDLGDCGLVGIEIDFADVIMDPDGLTAHGRVQIRAMIEEPE